MNYKCTECYNFIDDSFEEQPTFNYPKEYEEWKGNFVPICPKCGKEMERIEICPSDIDPISLLESEA